MTFMNRPALATAVLLSAALATAGCSGGGQASSSSAASASPAGTQSYASMLDLYSAVLSSGTTCSDVTIQPATTAKAQATCDLGGGKSLLLQTWRTSTDRDNGVQAVESSLAEGNTPHCVLAGTGEKGLWSVAARGDSTVCTAISHKLGGHATSSTGRG
jgi:hypothetical protein